MRIKRVQLKNFKRFTDLVIEDIPESSKLVLLIGSNGSGKSSLFDAFDWLPRGPYKMIPQKAEEYYRKLDGTVAEGFIWFHGGEEIVKGDTTLQKGHELVRKFIGRSSIRIVPRIVNDASIDAVVDDRDGPISFIENDTRFTNDIYLYMQGINDALREPVFQGVQADTLKIFRESIQPLNTSLLKIFAGDQKTTIQIHAFQDASPSKTAKLIFRKGRSLINYDLLSHGEKQVVILLINFIVRKQYYEDSIIFIDEMDNHLNTALQYALLEEIVTRWIPDSAQLWTASHALGFIDYARNSETASIIDFNLLDFDQQQVLTPQVKDRLDIYEIAVPKATISSILKGYKLVVVENLNDEHYNAALGQEGYLFLPANNNREVFLTIKGDQDKLGLRDRDYLTRDETGRITTKFPNYRILELYTFENYLYHPDNINELHLSGFDKAAYIGEIRRQKNEQQNYIIGEVGTSRDHYVEFKEGITRDDFKQIIDAIASDDFDTFYPFFNMKKHFNKGYLAPLGYRVADLSSTTWFKEKMLKILNG